MDTSKVCSVADGSFLDCWYFVTFFFYFLLLSLRQYQDLGFVEYTKDVSCPLLLSWNQRQNTVHVMDSKYDFGQLLKSLLRRFSHLAFQFSDTFCGHCDIWNCTLFNVINHLLLVNWFKNYLLVILKCYCLEIGDYNCSWSLVWDVKSNRPASQTRRKQPLQ